jgi:hypothetical protein
MNLADEHCGADPVTCFSDAVPDLSAAKPKDSNNLGFL